MGLLLDHLHTRVLACCGVLCLVLHLARLPCLVCVALYDTCVWVMCRGRHRVEDWVGEVQAWGGVGRVGVGWGGVVTYFADRIGTVLQILPLSPGIRVFLCPYPF